MDSGRQRTIRPCGRKGKILRLYPFINAVGCNDRCAQRLRRAWQSVRQVKHEPSQNHSRLHFQLLAIQGTPSPARAESYGGIEKTNYHVRETGGSQNMKWLLAVTFAVAVLTLVSFAEEKCSSVIETPAFTMCQYFHNLQGVDPILSASVCLGWPLPKKFCNETMCTQTPGYLREDIWTKHLKQWGCNCPTKNGKK